MATRDGLAQIWYADANGVVTGYTPTADNVASAIIDAYNKHFGTDINIWTPETKTLQVGGTVPNWNAYEKIEMPSIINVKTTPTGSSLWTMGKILGNTFKILCQNETSAWQVTDEGKINGVFGQTQALIEQIWTPKLQQAGYSISSFETEVVAYNVGDSVENWNDFTQV